MQRLAGRRPPCSHGSFASPAAANHQGLVPLLTRFTNRTRKAPPRAASAASHRLPGSPARPFDYVIRAAHCGACSLERSSAESPAWSFRGRKSGPSPHPTPTYLHSPPPHTPPSTPAPPLVDKAQASLPSFLKSWSCPHAGYQRPPRNRSISPR